MDWVRQSKSFNHTCSETELGWNIEAFQNPRCRWYICISMSCSLQAWLCISFTKHCLHRNIPSDISWNIEEITFSLTVGFMLELVLYFTPRERSAYWQQTMCDSIVATCFRLTYWQQTMCDSIVATCFWLMILIENIYSCIYEITKHGQLFLMHLLQNN